MKPLVLFEPGLPAFLIEPLSEAFDAQPRLPSSDSHASARGMVLPGGVSITTDELDAHPALELISVFGVGYDGVPIDACIQRGIRVTNTPDVLTEDVADIALALTLMSSRRLSEAERFLRSGKWSQGPHPLATSLTHKRVGIVGLGRIGKAIANRLAACGMTIAYHGRRPQPDVDYEFIEDLVDLARTSNVLVVACPGGPETMNLINAPVLDALGPEGLLVNIARGSVVDEPALIAALQSGRLGSAGLDVFANEPQVPSQLIEAGRVVLLPHVGSATHETRAAMAQLCFDNLSAHFAGKPLLTPVN